MTVSVPSWYLDALPPEVEFFAWAGRGEAWYVVRRSDQRVMTAGSVTRCCRQANDPMTIGL